MKLIASNPCATKDELRREIMCLRSVGAQMANVFFNWAQGHAVINPDDRSMMDGLRKEWDAIKRAEK